MIRKLQSGEFRLYSRKKDPRKGKRRNLGPSSRSPPRSGTSAPCSSSSGTEAAMAPKRTAKRNRTPKRAAGRYWSKRVMQTSDALDL
jgi:hypothetical protein